MPGTSSSTSCNRRCARTTTSKSSGRLRNRCAARRPPPRPDARLARRMRIRIVALGHRMPGWVTAGVDEYAKRIPREYGIELVELKPAHRDRGRSVPQLLADEARRLAQACEGASI